MKIKTIVQGCLAATMLLATPVFAESLTWQYIDGRYLQPSNSDTWGFSGEVSGHITDNLILQGRANRLERKDSDVDLEMSQMRFDLSIGWVFSFSDQVGLLVSGGYTHVDYSTDIGDFEEEANTDAANFQAQLRARFARSLEAEAGLGVLVDDEDASDLLWNVALRWWASDAVAFQVGANGVEDFGGDDILYEVGFRFDLN